MPRLLIIYSFLVLVFFIIMIFFVCKRKWKALLFSVLFLCVSSLITTSLYGIYRPVFHSHWQSIDLKQILHQVPSAKIYHQNKEVGTNFSLFRSWIDQDIVIKQEGFKDYFITLPTKWTEDSWAYSNGAGVPPGSPHSIRANELSTPIHTLFAGAFPPIGILFIPLGLFLDIGNLVSFPVLPVINPWKEYDIAPLKKQIILEPTEELRKNCNKDGYFISNIGCTSCLYEGPVVASKNELKRCQNRFQGLEYSQDYDTKFNYTGDDYPKTLYSYPCVIQENIFSTTEECGKCSGRHMVGQKCMLSCSIAGTIKDRTGECRPCDEQNAFKTEDEECNKCPNRKMFENAYCGLSECPENHIHDRNGFCYSCSEPYAVWTRDEKECAKCPYAQMVNAYTCQISCPPDKPLETYDRKCHACDESDFLKTDKENCDKCSNRRMLEVSYQKNNFHCVLACPPEKPLQDYKGKCYSCDDESAVFTDDEDCQKCPNRRMLSRYCLPSCQMKGSIQNYKGKCYSCDEENVISDIPEEECTKCPNREMAEWSRCVVKCPADKPMRNDEGKCYSCDEENEVWFSKEECAKCANREYNDRLMCIVKHCPKNRPLRGINGRCHSCDEKQSINIGDVTREKICNEMCPNRTIWRINGSCINKNCPVHDLDGNCHSCEEQNVFRTDEQECNRCPQRKYRNWQCYEQNAVIPKTEKTTYGTVPEGKIGDFNIIVIDPNKPLEPDELLKKLGLDKNRKN